jgi:hypothetical protein
VVDTSTIALGLSGAISAVAFFAFLSIAVWFDYRKKKDEQNAAHLERMKALELGQPLLDAEIARAKAYASAAWAAGLIGLLIPIVVISLTVVGTIVAVMYHNPWQNIVPPLIVAWSIAGVVMLVAVLRSLGVIQRLSQPRGDTAQRLSVPGSRGDLSSAGSHEKRLES